jgi:hypothetical protein
LRLSSNHALSSSASAGVVFHEVSLMVHGVCLSIPFFWNRSNLLTGGPRKGKHRLSV